MSNPWLDEAENFQPPVPPPGHTWTAEEILELRIAHLHEVERGWTEERERFVSEGRPVWQLDEAMKALSVHLKELAGDECRGRRSRSGRLASGGNGTTPS